MATVISKIGIKDSTGSGYDTRDLGAKCQNVEVGYDSSGNIISDVDKTTPTTTKTLSTTLQTLNNSITTLNKEKAPNDHSWTDGDGYGKASATQYGHIKTGTGLYVDSDSSSTTYGATNVNFASNGESSANKAVQSNDTRLSNARKNPNAVTFTTNAGSTGITYDGSAAKTVGYSTVGAAPAGHTTTAASSTILGHVKVGTGLSANSGALSVSYGSAAGTACEGNDSRLSDSRTPLSHAATFTSYGGGTSDTYGHVKLEDSYTSIISGESAAYSVAASAYALQSAYSTLNKNIHSLFYRRWISFTYSITARPSNGEGGTIELIDNVPIVNNYTPYFLLVGATGSNSVHIYNTALVAPSSGSQYTYYLQLRNIDSWAYTNLTGGMMAFYYHDFY